MRKPLAYFWLKAKFNQLCVLLGLKPCPIFYLSHVILKEHGFKHWCLLDTSAMVLEIDYPWTWQFKKFVKEHRHERQKP